MIVSQTVGVRDRANVTDTQTRADSKADKKAARIAAAKAKADERRRVVDQNIAKRAAAKQTAVEAVEKLGEEIVVRIGKMRAAQVALKEQAERPFKDFVDQRDSIAKLLADAQKKCKAVGMKFAEFQKRYAPNFGRTLTYELLRIGSGVISIEDHREHKRAKKAEERAAKKPSATTPVADAPTRDKVVTAANGAFAAVTGNGGDDPDGSKRKAEMARLASEEPPTQTAEPVVETQPQPSRQLNPVALVRHICEEAVTGLAEMPAADASDDALTCFKTMVAAFCPFMADVGEARKFISNEKLWRPKTPVRKAA